MPRDRRQSQSNSLRQAAPHCGAASTQQAGIRAGLFFLGARIPHRAAPEARPSDSAPVHFSAERPPHFNKIFVRANNNEFVGYKGMRGNSHGSATSTDPRFIVTAES